ncbi:WD repeat-containing protein 20-like isoform X2 [Pomacea canaliculata]|uniref:WD repeat-containing protein 20-like isoform X2 n=1 Tax=Pomacea canaliculata TaxID=400727 RepID=UPI000D73F529|nr:WD repeat-containing protein 20-like isoform X2 [Pomacea canaliculata]
MAVQSEGGGKDDLKTHFATREGEYKLMPLSEYSKPTRVAYNGQANPPVKVSFVRVDDGSSSPDRLCFNVGRELYVYVYKGVRKAADLTKPVDKRIYKGTFPTCHDFNTATVSSDSVLLLVGFTLGQVQLIDPIKKEISKLYNEERLIDKTKVTCIKWVPGSHNQFLVAHSSGQMYLYNEELPSGQTPPHYQPFKHGEGFSIFTCKTKSTRNPMYRWVIGQGAINEFAFSPCLRYLAVVSQDGHMRVFNYNSMELVGTMRSYFGGLLCVCWSPDGKYIVTGGEDDLVTVWSFHEKRVICRGHGHRSWVNVVAFDVHTCLVCDEENCEYVSRDVESVAMHNHLQQPNANHVSNSSVNSGLGGIKVRDARSDSSQQNGSHLNSNRNSTEIPVSAGVHYTSYRFGSVGQDTDLCLWELTEDVVKQPCGKIRTPGGLGANTAASGGAIPRSNSVPNNAQKINSVGNDVGHHHTPEGTTHPIQSAVLNATNKFATLSVADRKESQDKKEHKRNFSLASRNSDRVGLLSKSNHVKPVDDAVKLYGTPACPRLDEVPVLEPLVCKKIAHERLTSIVFREECVVTACQEGLVYTWARPGIMAHELMD